jgi:hypothetical protein
MALATNQTRLSAATVAPDQNVHRDCRSHAHVNELANQPTPLAIASGIGRSAHEVPSRLLTQSSCRAVANRFEQGSELDGQPSLGTTHHQMWLAVPQ